jgi:amino acid transporter
VTERIFDLQSCLFIKLLFAETLVTNFGPEGRISQVLPDTHWYRIFYAIGVLAFCLAISLIGAKAFSQATSFFGLILFGLIVTLLLSIFYPEHVSCFSVKYKNRQLGQFSQFRILTDFKCKNIPYQILSKIINPK